jgi:hypothetical protein
MYQVYEFDGEKYAWDGVPYIDIEKFLRDAQTDNAIGIGEARSIRLMMPGHAQMLGETEAGLIIVRLS